VPPERDSILKSTSMEIELKNKTPSHHRKKRAGTGSGSPGPPSHLKNYKRETWKSPFGKPEKKKFEKR